MSTTRKLIWAFLTVFGFFPVFLFATALAVIFATNWQMERKFYAHELSKQLVALNSEWSPTSKQHQADASKVFGIEISATALRMLLSGKGYSCDVRKATAVGNAQTLHCQVEAGYYDSFCTKFLVVEAKYEDAAKLNSITAENYLNCW